jgi:hypothetical protein
MVEYFCGQCGKTFYQKSHAEAHKKRKTPCKKPQTNPTPVPPTNLNPAHE